MSSKVMALLHPSIALWTPRGAWAVKQSRRLSSRHAWMHTMQSRCTSRCRGRVAHEQSSVRYSRTACRRVTCDQSSVRAVASVKHIAFLTSRDSWAVNRAMQSRTHLSRTCFYMEFSMSTPKVSLSSERMVTSIPNIKAARSNSVS